MAAVIRISLRGLAVWRLHAQAEAYFEWPS
jgi:hypothetical protein